MMIIGTKGEHFLSLRTSNGPTLVIDRYSQTEVLTFRHQHSCHNKAPLK